MRPRNDCTSRLNFSGGWKFSKIFPDRPRISASPGILVGMKFSELVFQERRGACTVEQAEAIVGGEQLLLLMRRAGWLVPVVEAKRLTRFDYDDCLLAWKRLRVEGYEGLKRAASQSNG